MYDNIFSMCTYFASEFESGQESKLMSVCLCYPGRGGWGWCQLIAGQDQGANRTDTPMVHEERRMRVREREMLRGASQSVKYEGNHSMGTHAYSHRGRGSWMAR